MIELNSHGCYELNKETEMILLWSLNSVVASLNASSSLSRAIPKWFHIVVKVLWKRYFNV